MSIRKEQFPPTYFGPVLLFFPQVLWWLNARKRRIRRFSCCSLFVFINVHSWNRYIFLTTRMIESAWEHGDLSNTLLVISIWGIWDIWDIWDIGHWGAQLDFSRNQRPCGFLQNSSRPSSLCTTTDGLTCAMKHIMEGNVRWKRLQTPSEGIGLIGVLPLLLGSR